MARGKDTGGSEDDDGTLLATYTHARLESISSRLSTVPIIGSERNSRDLIRGSL